MFAALTEQPIGVFQSASQFKGDYELFTYQVSGDVLRLVYPQTDDKEKVKARAWACREDGMDYCLELKGASRGVRRYRSKRGWEIGGLSRVDQIAERVAAIAGGAR